MIIGLDVGGTHTDAILIGDNGLEKETRILTDPASLFDSVLTAVNAVSNAIDPREINRIVLSTTLTTIAIDRKKFPAAGMIVSSGPGLDTEHFRTYSHDYSVSGRIDHRGREIRPLNRAEIEQIADE